MALLGVKLAITSRPVLALLLLGLLAGAAAQQVDIVDDDAEFDDDGPAGTRASAAGPVDGLLERLRLRVREQESYSLELYCAAILSIYLANMIIGSARNKRLALDVMGELGTPEGVLASNFSFVGRGRGASGAAMAAVAGWSQELIYDSWHCFKLWASGRRNCEGLLINLSTMRRQDLLAYGLQWYRGQRDVVELEVLLNPSTMPPLVLAVATREIAKAMQQESDDVADFCKVVEPSRDRSLSWPARLSVLAEHSSSVGDLLGLQPAVAELLGFGRSAAELDRCFRYLHITSACPDGGHSEVLRLSFSLPPAGAARVATLDRYMRLALLLTDLLANYQLGPETTKRAKEAREARSAKLAAAASGGSGAGGGDAAEQRRAAKLQEEADRLKRMTPEQRAKELERKEKLQRKRMLNKMTRKM